MCFSVRQILDTLEFTLAGAETFRAEVDGPVLETRRSGRPRRGGTNNELAWTPLMELIDQGKFNNADMVTHRFAFEDLPAAIDLVDKHPDGLIKAVIKN